MSLPLDARRIRGVNNTHEIGELDSVAIETRLDLLVLNRV